MGDNKDDIRRYRDGSMTSAERHRLEKRALNDPFLADALEGAETITDKNFAADLDALSQKIRVVPNPLFTPLRVAAGVVLILTVGSLGYYLNGDEPAQLASSQEKEQKFTDSVGMTKSSAGDSMVALAIEPVVEKPAQTSTKPVTTQSESLAATRRENPSVATAPTEVAAAGPSDAKITAQPEDPSKTEDKKAEPVATLAEEQVRADAPRNEAAGTGVKRAALAERSVALKDVVIKQVVRGTVTTEEEGTPLPGVNILVKGTLQGTVTDLHGNYSLPLPSNEATLTYSFIGMVTREIKPGNQSTLNVSLKADAVQLSEIVVVGQSQPPSDQDDFAKPVIRLAAPIGGIRTYNKYLENSLKYPAEALAKKIKGKVVITFTVTTTGSLTDFNVVRGLGYGCEEEVVRLVKEGPGWTPSFEDDIPVESEVRVKLKFDPENANK